MRAMNSISRMGRTALRAIGLSVATLAANSYAAAPGISGTSFDLVAAAGYISQPDGASIYSWGYGCTTEPKGRFVPAVLTTARCSAGDMQLPGPTLVVTEGTTVTVTLTNKLPPAAGRTSILFPGMDVCVGDLIGATLTSPGTCNAIAGNGSPGLLTQEAATNGTVRYSFVAKGPGTHSYYSGTQGDLQVEMGLFGALIVLPQTVPANCGSSSNPTAIYRAAYVERHGLSVTPPDFRLSQAVFNNALACYDREYLFQFSELDPVIHQQAADQAAATCDATTHPNGCMNVNTEPYHAVYFLINGRSMPDSADPNYAPMYPRQPYNGNPHMHPGEIVLVRIIGQGRMQHPFHEHANHLRVLARDGTSILNAAGRPSGPLLFTTTTTPGQTMDAVFQWTGKGLNWDVYGHKVADANGAATTDTCDGGLNGYHSVAADNNFFEWCGDHTKPLESKPFGNVGGGGPVTLPDPNILANGAWYSGSPYFGPDANMRSVGPTPIPPFGTIANDPGSEAGFAYMWHSHNEREITTNNIFPGGMMMMMLVDPWVFLIDETN